MGAWCALLCMPVFVLSSGLDLAHDTHKTVLGFLLFRMHLSQLPSPRKLVSLVLCSADRGGRQGRRLGLCHALQLTVLGCGVPRLSKVRVIPLILFCFSGWQGFW